MSPRPDGPGGTPEPREPETPPASGGRGLFQRIVREPLTHFVVIGAVLFAAQQTASYLQRPVVRLEAKDLDQLASYWEVQMQRPPNREELAGIIQDRIDEELLAREALRLGLDKDDMIIRRRLAQKMSFATDDVAQVKEPSEAILRAYYARTADRYAAPARVSFQQVFFSGDRPAGGAAKAAGQALERAEETNRTDPTGDPFLFPLTYDDVSIPGLQRDYGPAFVKLLETAPVGGWQGPVISPYGWHLVRISARQAGVPASFDAVRDQVHAAYMADHQADASAAFMRDLHRRYRVLVAGVPES